MSHINRSVHRAIEIIKLLHTEGPLSLEEIHVILGLSKATLYRILSQIESENWIYRYLADGRYCLANSIFSVDHETQSRIELAKISKSTLKKLFEKTGHPSDLAIKLSNLVIIESSFGETKHRSAAQQVIGLAPEEKHSSLWKAYLDQGKQICDHGAYYPRTFNHWEHSFNARFHYNAIAVPLEINDTVIGALNIAIIGEPTHPDVIAEHYLSDLRTAAYALTEKLGAFNLA